MRYIGYILAGVLIVSVGKASAQPTQSNSFFRSETTQKAWWEKSSFKPMYNPPKSRFSNASKFKEKKPWYQTSNDTTQSQNGIITTTESRSKLSQDWSQFWAKVFGGNANQPPAALNVTNGPVRNPDGTYTYFKTPQNNGIDWYKVFHPFQKTNSSE